MISIEPLSIDTLEAAISLAEKSFSLDFNTDHNRIRTALEATIYPQKYPDRFDGRIVPNGIKFWVALGKN